MVDDKLDVDGTSVSEVVAADGRDFSVAFSLWEGCIVAAGVTLET